MPPSDPLPDWLLQQRREIGDRVRDTRKQANLTQEQLAGLAFLERRTIWRIEHGRASTPVDVLLNIARILGVAPSELFPDERAE